MPSVPIHQPKWIHQKLWAREEKEDESRRSSFLSNLKQRSWGRGHHHHHTSRNMAQGRWFPYKHPYSQLTWNVLLLSQHPLHQPFRSLPLHSSKHAKPTKSIFSSHDSLALKKHGRARSGSGSALSVKSVKFTEAPTVYYDTEYTYEQVVHWEEYRPCSPAPSSTTPNSSCPAIQSKRPTTTLTSIRLCDACNL